MIKVPFKRESFAREMKPKISGANLSLEYDNIESSLMKVAAEIARTLPQALIDRLSTEYISGNPVQLSATAIDYLQRAMLHFTIYEHLIFLITRVSNDGVTIKKNDDETTAYKYQVDELNNKLITTAWFWMNLLIRFLNDHLDNFPEWAGSDEKKTLDELPVDLSDFNRWVGVSMAGGEYFMMCAGWIIREVWIDCVCSRFREPVKTSAIARAVCYEVMGRATQRLAYSALPEPVRIDIDNEMGKNHRAAADKYIREYVAGQLINKAETYWNAVDMEIKKQDIEQQRKSAGSRPLVGERNLHESDKFCFT
ncbi:MAG: hypothetical protein LBG15_07930 [Dysgonamonadaceae bacterium]|jgi:hypothetical protein|nr:hypothetical protein [Dysgonamonadaceae bacterium]